MSALLPPNRYVIKAPLKNNSLRQDHRLIRTLEEIQEGQTTDDTSKELPFDVLLYLLLIAVHWHTSPYLTYFLEETGDVLLQVRLPFFPYLTILVLGKYSAVSLGCACRIQSLP